MHSEHVQHHGSRRGPYHTLRVFHETDGSREQRKRREFSIRRVGGLFVAPPNAVAVVEEELNRRRVELQRDGLQQGDVIGHDLLVVKVEVALNELVDVVVAEQVEQRRLQLNVLQHDGERLQKLKCEMRPSAGGLALPVARTMPRLLVYEPGEVRQRPHLDEGVEKRGLVLVSPDHQLRNLPEGLHQRVAVRGGDRGSARDDVIEPPELIQGEPILTLHSIFHRVEQISEHESPLPPPTACAQGF